jgi:pimeloyl-ACP methyl ester carboxylesterase
MPRVKSNGIEIEYDTFGSRGDEPLLLIMGLGSQMVLWHEEFCAALAGRGHFVVRFDNRDIGRSTWLEHFGVPNIPELLMAVLQGDAAAAPYAIDDMADDTIGLLDALELEQAHVCGVSMGGMIAQTMALRRPERLKSMTSIMSTTGDRDLPPPRPEAMMALAQPPADSLEGVLERALMINRAIGSPGFTIDPDEIRARARLQYERGYNPAGMARQFAAVLSQSGRRERLAGVDLPALVIHGTDDPLVPVECGEATAAAIPGAARVLIEGMGHDLPRAVWPTIIDSLSDLTGRAAG